MTRGLLAACALAALAMLGGPAAADPKVQVLQADGRADAKVRARVDAGILALARSGGEQVIPGDITFTEAAAAVGCKADAAACKDEVLGMLSVDEIVITTVTPKPGGFEVAVRRVGKGGAAREAISFVAYDRLDKLEAIAPLFSAKPAPAPPAPAPPPAGATPVPFGPRPAPPPPPPPSNAVTTTPQRPPSEVAPVPPSDVAPPPSPVSRRVDPSSPFSDRADDRPRPRRRLQAVGMATGGTLLTVGLVLWASAASVQSEIDAAPVGTKTQLRDLQALEDKGDAYAGLGNLFVVGGLVVGGISTYYFVKAGRRRATSARLVPVVWDRGGGIAFAIGGAP
jgi:hypothetical protein